MARPSAIVTEAELSVLDYLAQDISQRVRYAEIERKIDAAVQEGKLSLEDAEKKLIAARKEIYQD